MQVEHRDALGRFTKAGVDAMLGVTVPFELIERLGVDGKVLAKSIRAIMKAANVSKDGAAGVIAHAVAAENAGMGSANVTDVAAKAAEIFGKAPQAGGRMIGLAGPSATYGGFSLSQFLRGAKKAGQVASGALGVASQLAPLASGVVGQGNADMFSRGLGQASGALHGLSQNPLSAGLGFAQNYLSTGSPFAAQRPDMIATRATGLTDGPGGMYGSGAGGLIVGGAGGAGGLIVGGRMMRSAAVGGAKKTSQSRRSTTSMMQLL